MQRGLERKNYHINDATLMPIQKAQIIEIDCVGQFCTRSGNLVRAVTINDGELIEIVEG